MSRPAAGVKVPAAGRATVSGGARLGPATSEGSAGSRRRSLPASCQAWIIGLNAVTGGGQTWFFNGGSWQPGTGGGVRITVHPGGAPRLVNASGQVWRLQSTGWQQLSGGVRIAVGPDGLPWIVNSWGAIYHLTSGGWVNIPGGAVDIGAGADGSVWILGQNAVTGGFQTYHYNGSGWDGVNGGGVAITVGPDGMPWVVNNRGQIFERV